MPGPFRIEVMHGVNLDMLGKREPEHYGTLTLDELERQIEGFAGELGVGVRFFHSNFEGEYVEHLHNLGELVDAVVLNPGAWTHYAWAIHDALATAGLPASRGGSSRWWRISAWRRSPGSGSRATVLRSRV
jgi:3-dehydroquinate dehydratase-2